MAANSTGAEYLRDATKWLTTSVPLAGVAGLVVAVGPGVVDSLAPTQSSSSWIEENFGVLLGIVLVLTGIAIILILGGLVLSARPGDLATLIASKDLGKAFQNGVGFPYFYSGEKFTALVADVHLEWANGRSASENDMSRIVAVSEMLREWSLDETVARSFKRFVRGLIVSIILMVIGSYAIAVSMPTQVARITSIQDVVVNVTETGKEDLAATTGCTNMSQSTFRAIGGDWLRPLLLIDGPGCKFGARWEPDPAMAEVIPARGR